MWCLLLRPFYRPGNGGRGEPSHLSKAPQPVSAELRSDPVQCSLLLAREFQRPFSRWGAVSRHPGGSAGAPPSLSRKRGGRGRSAERGVGEQGTGPWEHLTHRTTFPANTLHFFLFSRGAFYFLLDGPAGTSAVWSRSGKGRHPRLVPIVEGSPHPFAMKQDVGCGFFIDALFENTLET